MRRPQHAAARRSPRVRSRFPPRRPTRLTRGPGALRGLLRLLGRRGRLRGLRGLLGPLGTVRAVRAVPRPAEALAEAFARVLPSPSPASAGFVRNTAVAVSGLPRVPVAVPVPASAAAAVSRKTASRGSLSLRAAPDDFCCSDLSGDSPATDASSMRRGDAPALSEPATSVLCEPSAGLLDENDIPTGSRTKHPGALDRPM